MRIACSLPSLLAAAWLALIGCAGRTETGSGGGSAGLGAAGGTGGLAGVGGATGDPCRTPEGVRLCGGSAAACGWVGPGECPGGGCARAFDRMLGGESVAGVCFSDLADNGIRSCWGCNDGEVCLERAQGELVCVPESVCAGLWALGAKGVCRYADLSAYDGRPLKVLVECPSLKPGSLLCGGPCESCSGAGPPPCTGRSPDHPQGFCTSSEKWCALEASGYLQECPKNSGTEFHCGVFRVSAVDQPVALHYGRCLDKSTCAQLAAELPGGFDCHDQYGNLSGGGTK